MRKIIIPPNVNKDTMREVVIAFREYVDDPDDDKTIDIDMTQIRFIEPMGVVALNNIIQWGRKHEGIKGSFVVATEETCTSENRVVMNYLVDCGFFASLGNSNIFKYQDQRSTMLNLRDIEPERIEQWKITDLKTWLQRQTGRKNEFTAICVAIDEIFNNISDHSEEHIGCIFGQYYPRKNELVIAISDFGIGIPQSIKRNFEQRGADNELIEFALGEGISSRSVPQNRGAGLANVMRTVTTNGIGEFTIISNCGIVGIKDNEIKSSVVLDKSYPGTLFEIKIDTSNENLYDTDMEEEFEWL